MLIRHALSEHESMSSLYTCKFPESESVQSDRHSDFSKTAFHEVQGATNKSGKPMGNHHMLTRDKSDTQTKLCCSPTMKHEIEGPSKPDVCNCRGTLYRDLIPGDVTPVYDECKPSSLGITDKGCEAISHPRLRRI